MYPTKGESSQKGLSWPSAYLLLLAQWVSELILGEVEERHRAIHGAHQDAQTIQRPERDGRQ